MYNIYITQTNFQTKEFQQTAKKASEETFLSVVCERFIFGKRDHYQSGNRT